MGIACSATARCGDGGKSAHAARGRGYALVLTSRAAGGRVDGAVARRLDAANDFPWPGSCDERGLCPVASRVIGTTGGRERRESAAIVEEHEGALSTANFARREPDRASASRRVVQGFVLQPVIERRTTRAARAPSGDGRELRDKSPHVRERNSVASTRAVHSGHTPRRLRLGGRPMLLTHTARSREASPGASRPRWISRAAFDSQR